MTLRLSQIVDSLAERSATATISQNAPDSEPLRRYLREALIPVEAL